MLVAQSHPTLCNLTDCVTHQAPQSMGFSRQEYWSRLPFPSPGDLPDTGIEPGSPELQADVLPSKPPGKTLDCNKTVAKSKDGSVKLVLISEYQSELVIAFNFMPQPTRQL